MWWKQRLDAPIYYSISSSVPQSARHTAEAQQTLTELMIALNTEGTWKNFLQFGYQAYIYVH